MPIKVRYDDQLAQLIANSKRSAYAQDAASAQQNPETDANQFTMSRANGQRAAASLARDREGLADKQKKRYGDRQDSYAGFDWLTPISIKGHKDAQGRDLNTTVYRRDGPDPLAAGAWGSLGSAEHIINDPTQQINVQDPAERAKVEGLSRSGISGVVDDDAFKSAQEIEGEKWAREDARANKKFQEQQTLKAQFDAENDQRTLDRQLKAMDAMDARDERRKSEKQAKEDAGYDAEYGAAKTSIDSKLGEYGDPGKGFGYEDPGQGYSWVPAQLQEIERLRTAAAEIQIRQGLTKQARAEAMKQIAERLNALRPIRDVAPNETPEQKSQRAMEDYRQRKGIDKEFETPKPEKPQFSTSDLSRFRRDAVEELKAAGFDPPGQDQIRAKMKEIMDDVSGASPAKNVFVAPQEEGVVRQKVREMIAQGRSRQEIEAAIASGN